MRATEVSLGVSQLGVSRAASELSQLGVSLTLKPREFLASPAGGRAAVEGSVAAREGGTQDGVARLPAACCAFVGSCDFPWFSAKLSLNYDISTD